MNICITYSYEYIMYLIYEYMYYILLRVYNVFGYHQTNQHIGVYIYIPSPISPTCTPKDMRHRARPSVQKRVSEVGNPRMHRHGCLRWLIHNVGSTYIIYYSYKIYTHERVAVLLIQRRSTSSSGKSDNIHTHAYPIPNGMPAGKKGIRKCSLSKNLMTCAHHSNQE